MTIVEFIVLMAGGLTELGLLYVSGYETDKEQGEGDNWLTTTFSYAPAILAGGLTLLGIAYLLSYLDFANIRFSGLDEFSTITIGVLFAAVLFGSVVGNYLLPRVNEQQMLLIHVLVGINLFFSDRLGLPDWALWLLLLPTLALVYQALWPKAFSIYVKALYYLWYLVTLVALAFQNRGELFTAVETSPLDMFIFMSILVFLGVHILAALRFVLIITSLIIPRNRPLLAHIMPHLVSDAQMPLLNLGLILVVVLLLFGLNLFYEVVLDQMLINALVLGVSHFGMRAVSESTNNTNGH